MVMIVFQLPSYFVKPFDYVEPTSSNANDSFQVTSVSGNLRNTLLAPCRDCTTARHVGSLPS